MGTGTLEESAKQEAEKLLRDMKLQQRGPGIEAGEGNAKRSAIVAVDILIREQTMWQNGQDNPIPYWQTVKQELLKLT